MVFERPHHQRIASILSTLDAETLRRHRCWFGGGTAIALTHGEFRESVDIDFLVSDLAGYRALRELLTGPLGMLALARTATPPWRVARDVRADQYGLRTALHAGGDRPIKFEIVLEGRIAFDVPGADQAVCGVATLTPSDMAASKLLASEAIAKAMQQLRHRPGRLERCMAVMGVTVARAVMWQRRRRIETLASTPSPPRPP